jgi:hypothetical protein
MRVSTQIERWRTKSYPQPAAIFCGRWARSLKQLPRSATKPIEDAAAPIRRTAWQSRIQPGQGHWTQ